MPERLAVISYHSSPLLEPGVGDSGGMTIYVRELSDALAQRGVTTDVYTRSDRATHTVAELSTGVRVIGIPAGEGGPPVPKGALIDYVDDFVVGTRAYAAAQRLRYDVLHSHYWQSGLAARALAGAWSIPHVHSHHTLGLLKNRFLAPGDEPEPQMRIDGEHRVIGDADVLVASTDEEWQQLSCLYKADHDRLKTIHPGVNHDLFGPAPQTRARQKLGLTDAPTVLYVGRIQRLKGLELAIRALHELMPVLDRDPRLLIVGGASGTGGDVEIMRLSALAAELNLTEQVRFLGPKPHRELALFYQAADALVVCSHYESFGLAALEAQACGTPVVATCVGGLSHVVQDGGTGFLVESRDPSVFAARLKTLLSDRELRGSFGDNALARSRLFSWNRTADELLELYRCLEDASEPELCTC